MLILYTNMVHMLNITPTEYQNVSIAIVVMLTCRRLHCVQRMTVPKYNLRGESMAADS